MKLFGESEEDGKVWTTNDSLTQDEALNGLHPVWNKSFEPHLVANKDMAFLEFTLTEVLNYL